MPSTAYCGRRPREDMGWSRFFRRRYWDRERSRELQTYIDIEAGENIARGMRPDEARCAAHRKLGKRDSGSKGDLPNKHRQLHRNALTKFTIWHTAAATKSKVRNGNDRVARAG